MADKPMYLPLKNAQPFEQDSIGHTVNKLNQARDNSAED